MKTWFSVDDRMRRARGIWRGMEKGRMGTASEIVVDDWCILGR
jgi:hypothetical protein